MKEIFEKYLDKILPCILQAMNDEIETVREISMRAAQAIINEYTSKSLFKILPVIENGLFQDNWRIRSSSIQLLGDILDNIIENNKENNDISSKENKEKIDIIEPNSILLNALGFEKRAQILASVYISRSDVSSLVRQKAIVIWKTVVHNTPKSLREILPILIELIIQYLASKNIDIKQAAETALG